MIFKGISLILPDCCYSTLKMSGLLFTGQFPEKQFGRARHGVKGSPDFCDVQIFKLVNCTFALFLNFSDFLK